jgi:hypothetical protein
MTRLIYLTSNHTSPDPLRSDWTARWDGLTETGRTIGEAIDRIVRHAPDGRLDRLAIVVREGAPVWLEATPAAERAPGLRGRRAMEERIETK